MIDHVLGRPSVQFRKIQVLAVVCFWSAYLFKGNKNGPPQLRRLSRALSNVITPWQTLVITLLYLYIARNLGKLLNLECPEPLANLYTRSYFRATWVTTALDAGFWTAMRIRRKWLRDIFSMVFSVYYLIAAEQADEKVRKVRGMLTLDHLRVSWNKPNTPYLAALSRLVRPRLMRYPPRQVRIPRPANSDYKEPVKGWLYFDGPLSALQDHTKIVLDIPGGGFVAMDPRTNDDKLMAWAGKTGLPVLSLDYQKAPESPYPYALNECFDVYQTLIFSRGKCVGFSGNTVPKVVVTGDSAGGNLATGMVLMIIESSVPSRRRYEGQYPLPVPDGLILIYPGLDLNISNWISDEQMSLIEDRKMRKVNRDMLRQKSMQYTHLAGTPHPSDVEGDHFPGLTPLTPKKPKTSKTPKHQLDGVIAPMTAPTPPVSSPDTNARERTISDADRKKSLSHRPAPMQTRLAMSSIISYFNDRILSPEMMRSMIILYIGPNNRPNFSTDYLLSPILAPDSLLERFPKTFFMCGERDPMVDDTVIFAGRIRKAKLAQWERESHIRLASLNSEFEDREVVEVSLIPGISHGFMQFVGAYPEGWKQIYRCGRWIEVLFAKAEETDPLALECPPGWRIMGDDRGDEEKHHRRQATDSSGDEGLEIPLMMTRRSSKGLETQSGHDKAQTEEHKHKERESVKKRKQRFLKEHADEKLSASAEEARKWGKEKSLKRTQSLVSMNSGENLLGRRMEGMVVALTGMGDDGANDA